MKRAIITVGLGFGDEGKGAWVDKLCRDNNADLVVRYSGGSQCGHTVQITPRPGKTLTHTFSQFGAGTIAGVKTYLGPQVILNLPALIKEAQGLLNLQSPHEPDQKWAIQKFMQRQLTVHPYCLISTIYHRKLNQLMELLRGDSHDSPDRHGSCGHGIGETRKYWLTYGTDAITMADTQDRHLLTAKLELCRQRLLATLPCSGKSAMREFNIPPVAVEMEKLHSVGLMLALSPTVPNYQMAIFEGAQGVLLDEWYGFHPHTTWSTVTPYHGVELALASQADQVSVLGVHRTYHTRHGNGPFPTFDEHLTKLWNDPNNQVNPWQGRLRCGWLDLPLFQYAVAACGQLDGLLVSHLDQMGLGFSVCEHYTIDNTDWRPTVLHYSTLERQAEIGMLLSMVQPMYTPVRKTRDLFDLLRQIVPVIGTSVGPEPGDRSVSTITYRDRSAFVL